MSGVFGELATLPLDVVDRCEVCHDGKIITDWARAYTVPIFSLFLFPSAPVGLILGAISIPYTIYEKKDTSFRIDACRSSL